MDPAIAAALSTTLVAVITTGATLLNRRNVTRVADADAEGKRADAADVLVDTAMILVADARAEAERAREALARLDRLYRVTLRRLEVALAYIALLVHAIELDGKTPPPKPAYDPHDEIDLDPINP